MSLYTKESDIELILNRLSEFSGTLTELLDALEQQYDFSEEEETLEEALMGKKKEQGIVGRI